MRALVSERSAIVGVQAIALLLAVGWLIPRFDSIHVYSGVHPERFWTMKAHFGPDYDMAVLGDSRVYRGVSPGAMQAELRGMRVANFGFSAAVLTRDYLEAGSALIDPGSNDRLIVLGVSPHALTQRSSKKNGFVDETRRTWSEVIERLYLTPLLAFFTPMDLAALADAGGETRYYHDMRADGWVASRRSPQSTAAAYEAYGKLFDDNRASPAIVDGVLAAVARWRSAGIEVYGFRPPSSTGMREIEAERSGFDETTFVERFERAGGLWIAMPERYHSYDGSHLEAAAAASMSRDLAAAIRGARPPKAPRVEP